ncbi:glycoside hydrolase family 97 C-terminal domain-containing protein [Massilia sp. S19_KUP03_FR1]|uniref:glycoside hydrolase family 97 C-terminal domain-containing protein n=1 Tax=Massilia sp. S19_KUP03_FR1 TaxID=3025503 RepID=UPI002FCD6F52
MAFLDAGQRYSAEIYRDGDQADYRTARHFELVTETKTVTAQDVLQVRRAAAWRYT